MSEKKNNVTKLFYTVGLLKIFRLMGKNIMSGLSFTLENNELEVAPFLYSNSTVHVTALSLLHICFHHYNAF